MFADCAAVAAAAAAVETARMMRMTTTMLMMMVMPARESVTERLPLMCVRMAVALSL